MGIDSLIKNTQELTGRQFILPVRSGSVAIIAGLIASGLPKGCHIIIPAISCFAVLSAIYTAGYTPIMADIELDSFQIGSSQVNAVLSENDGGVMAIHNFGLPAKLSELEDLSKNRKLILIEDACLSLGSKCCNKPMGANGLFSLFSFGYDKIIDSGGGGGMLLTDSPALYHKASNFVTKNPFFAFPLERVETVLKDMQLLEDNLLIRNRNAQFLHSNITNPNVKKLSVNDNDIFWRYTFLYTGDRDALVKQAKESGIIFTTHFQSLHLFRTGIQLPNATYFSKKVVNLFVRPGASLEYLENAVNIINTFQD